MGSDDDPAAAELMAICGGLERLRRVLQQEGGLMASLLVEDGVEATGVADGPAQIAAAGPRAAGSRAEYELLVEAIYEGYLLHYGAPRLVHAGEADLRVLAGDRMYAIGLARLVALGDLLAVAELADTITLSALAEGSGDAELAAAVWEAGARAVGWGSSGEHRQAKDLLLAGAPEAIEAMRTSAALAPAAP